MIIDNSQPVGDNDNEMSIDSARKKMYRDVSPKEKHFAQLTRGPNNLNNSELGNINKKHDMIKQLQDKLSLMKQDKGQRHSNNSKNVSSIRCKDNTYIKPYPQMIRARHMKLMPAKKSGNKTDAIRRETDNSEEKQQPKNASQVNLHPIKKPV